MIIIFIIIGFAVIWFFEAFPLLQDKQIGKLIIYSTLLSGALILSILMASEVKIISPATLIGEVLKPVKNMLQGVIQ